MRIAVNVFVILWAAGGPWGLAQNPTPPEQAADTAQNSPGPEIQWDGKALKGPALIKRFYRLKKSNQWTLDRLPRYCELAIATGDPTLIRYATWYQALIAGHAGDNELAKTRLLEAVELGYTNVLEMETAEELAQVREDPDLQPTLQRLRRELQERLTREFEAGINGGFAATETSPPEPWNPTLEGLDGKPFWNQQPILVAVSRIHHAGFEKQLPLISKAGSRIPVGVIFWQYDADDTARREQTVAYAKKMCPSVPCAIVGRDRYLELRSQLMRHFKAVVAARRLGRLEGASKPGADPVFTESLPFTVFFDGEARPLNSTAGVLQGWQMDYAVGKFQDFTPPLEAPAKGL